MMDSESVELSVFFYQSLILSCYVFQEVDAVTRQCKKGASDVVDSVIGECPVSPRVARDRQAYRMC